MTRLLQCTLLVLVTATLVGCSMHPRKSMFPPTVSVQQLTVLPDGHWRMQVRILNNSYGGMTFRRLQLTMQVDNQPAAQIDTRIDMNIPALSPGITPVNVIPDAHAAAALAAIADKGSAATLAYSFEGTATAIPEHTDSSHAYPVKSHAWLSAVPGVAHTFR